MTQYKKQRLIILSIGLLCTIAAVAIFTTVFKDNIVFFYSPADFVEKKVPQGRFVRVGGLVKKDSLDLSKKPKIEFILTDLESEFTVEFTGILPNLFRDGQGIIAEGELRENVFFAERLLAKHDENYMPPEVADALKEAGHWQDGAK